MIKPVTFQGQFNFNANLYALEVKSRFIDQNNAHGYYTGYGDELAAMWKEYDSLHSLELQITN